MSGAGYGNMVTPNMLSLCVDGTGHGGICGRMYSCYEKKPVPFQNEHGLIHLMEHFMDALNFPQSSVNLRSYHQDGRATMRHIMEPHSPQAEEVEELLKHSGEAATLLVYVKYRQNATWQGTVVCRESGWREDFRSELEFLKIIDRAVGWATDSKTAAWAE